MGCLGNFTFLETKLKNKKINTKIKNKELYVLKLEEKKINPCSGARVYDSFNSILGWICIIQEYIQENS